jgi:RNA polymerase sigma-70 factor, ECF subfamily
MAHNSMPSEDITELVRRWGRGDRKAADELFPLVYDELRKMAHRYFRGESPENTLQPTALVHDLFLKLSKNGLDVQDRSHFYAVAARQMRHLLIDHARAARAEKRGGLFDRLSQLQIAAPSSPSLDGLALEEALGELEGLDPRIAQGVELRYFAGLTESEAAEVLDISLATLKRDWQFARAWLRARLTTESR